MSVGGYQLLLLGQGWLVFELSSSALDLGYLGAAAALPNMSVSLFGGMLADRIDKRCLLITTNIVIALLLVVLAILDASESVAVWHVLAIVAAISAVTGLDWPARQSFFPGLVERKNMMSAVALNSVVWQVTRLAIPGVGGLIIAFSDTWVLFFLGALGSVGMSLALVGIAPGPKARAVGLGLAQFLEGLRYVVKDPLFSSLVPLTYCCMFFGTSVVQIMPLYADRLGSDETGYGLLVSAIGLGSVLGTFAIGPYQRSSWLGWFCLVGLGLTAASLGGFALVTGPLVGTIMPLALALVAMLAMGFFSTVYLVSSMTVMQLKVPEELRGRVMGLHGITYSLIPLGGLLGGVLSELWTPSTAVAINSGLLLVAAVYVGVTKPAIRRLDGTLLGAG